MNHWQPLLLLLAGLLLLCAVFCSALAKHRERRQRDFIRKLETLLQPRETVKVICPQKGFRCILTGSRIILEKKGSFTAYPIKSITRLQGTNAAGNRTTAAKNMVCLTVKMDPEITLRNTGAEFEELTKLLQQMLKKQSSRKKT